MDSFCARHERMLGPISRGANEVDMDIINDLKVIIENLIVD